MVQDTWSEKTLLSIQKLDGTAINFEAIIETIDQSGGEKGFDSIASISGGRLKKFNPQEDMEVTLEGYAVEVATETGTAGKGFYDLMHSQETSQPLSISVDHERDEYMVCMMATDNSSQADAVSVTTSTDKAERWTFKNGHFTNVVASFTDKVWKFTITYKCPPFNKSAASNVTYESTDGTAAKILPAVTYTS